MRKNLIKIASGIVILIAVVAITACVIYFAIPNSTAQSIVTTIVAAIYGGLLTLLGVRWTIKKGEQDRKDDERKKYFPFVKLVNNVKWDFKIDPRINKGVDIDKDKEAQSCNTFYKYDIVSFAIKNIAESVIILDSIIINGNSFTFKENTTFEKNTVCFVAIGENTNYYCSWENLKEISLIFKDILGNRYKAKCSFGNKRNIIYGTQQNNHGKKFTYECSNRYITSIELPELMQKEK